MKTGIVNGSVWATKKAEGLAGMTLLSVDTDRGNVIAADLVGAGMDDLVLLSFGSCVRHACGACPIDAAVVGILDMQEERHE